MEGHVSQPSERISGLQEYLARWSSRIHPVKSPEEGFQEDFKKDEASLKDLVQRPGDVLDEILSCVTRMKQLQAQHKSTKEQKERLYQHKLWKQQETMVFELFDQFGFQLSKMLYNNWYDRRGRPFSTTSTQSDTTSGTIDVERPEDATSSRVTLNPDRTKTTDESPAGSTRGLKSSPPNTQSAGEPNLRPSEAERTKQTTTRDPQKRPAGPLAVPATRPAKRSRLNTTHGPLTDRTIEFDQVYQNGHAEHKYVIIKMGKFWYILECERHRMRFQKIRGAQKHLRGKKHKDAPVTYREAIGALGTRVLNCDDDKASQNNDVAQRPSYSEMGRPVTGVPPSVGYSLPTRRNQGPTGIKPKPGEVYTTFWGETGEFYAILVLPWRNVGQFGHGLPLSVKDTSLIDNVPSCYQYNHADKLYEWAPEYRPCGQHYTRRQYPVIYFDADVFPGVCGVDWVAARDFKLYDPEDAGIPFKNIVDGYIASRNSGAEEEDPPAMVQLENSRGIPTADARTTETSPSQQLSDARSIIDIGDASDDRTEPSTSTKSDGPVVKTESSDEAMTDVPVRQRTRDAPPHRPLTAPSHSTPDHSEPGNLLLTPVLLARDGCQNSSNAQTQTRNDGPTSLGGVRKPSPVDATNHNPHKLSQPTRTAALAPVAIMAPSPPDQNPPPVPSPCNTSQTQPTAKPRQGANTTGLHGQLSQARNPLSSFHQDKDGNLKWNTLTPLSGVLPKQRPVSASQQ